MMAGSAIRDPRRWAASLFFGFGAAAFALAVFEMGNVDKWFVVSLETIGIGLILSGLYFTWSALLDHGPRRG